MDGYHAWMLMSASLVLMMTTPALALFYGGMSRSKSVLNMMMMSFGALGVVGIVYVLWGWSMSYSTTIPSTEGAGKEIGKFFSNPFNQFGLTDTDPANYVFVAFQLTFAVITAALISGAIADRVKFSAWLVFVPIWVTLSYFPLAHMVWGGGFLSGVEGGLADMLFGGDGGAEVFPIDYAGGTVVHINAGIAGLVLALVIGKRLGFGKEPMKPHNLTLTMIGAGLLWFGWFGFNVGSIVFVGATEEENITQFTSETGLVWLTTTLATCAAMLGWLLVEKIRDGKSTSLGAASGVVAGLVAITPACGAVMPLGAIAIGLLAGVGCSLAVGLKYRFGYDDSLDVVGVHLVGGLIGTLGIGLFASAASFTGVDGLLYGGGIRLLVVQLAVAVFAMVWSAVATLLVAYLIKVTMGWRIAEEDEVEGIDFVEHGEAGYDLTARGGSVIARPGTLVGTLANPVEGAGPAEDSAPETTKEGTMA
jgi:Amt family ammonium transporter